MRKLTEITDDVRRGIVPSEREFIYAICAYDVLLAQLDLPSDPVRMAKFFQAVESDPEKYIGWVNDPANPEVVAWHEAFINLPPAE